MAKAPKISGRSFVAAQEFLISVKSFWTTQLYPRLDKTKPVEEIEQTIEYDFYAWLERHLQRHKYSGRYGIHCYHEQFRDKITSELNDNDLLVLDKNIKLPKYYTEIDIHQHPGGLSSDEIAGFVYERGARSTTPLESKNHKDLHHRLKAVVTSKDIPSKILDMACGFGKSTQPFYTSLPKTDVIGIDLSAPCLRLAALEAKKLQAKNIKFKQANAENTNFRKENFDLVTSTMLLHELPPKSIEAIFEETYRLLEPGGKMVHLDFYLVTEEFNRFIYSGHSKRNNEPFMMSFIDMDIQKILEQKGFSNIVIEPFEEADGTLAADYKYWRFPWTIISAEKPI